MVKDDEQTPAIEQPSNDPVYSQPQGDSVQGGIEVDESQRKSTNAEADIEQPSNDPVYSQPQGDSPRGGQKASDDTHTSHAAIEQPSNDPVYSQPQGDSPRRGQAVSDDTHTSNAAIEQPSNDPVYSQPQGDSSNQGTEDSNSTSTAKARIQQLSSHVQPNTKRRRRKSQSKPSNDLPADYSDILAHLSTMKRITQNPDPTNRGYARQKQAGKLWARERISKILDEGTWREIGSAAGTASWTTDAQNPQSEHVESYIPSNNPQGLGRITDPKTGMRRQVYLTADDFSIRSGHADGATPGKSLYGEKLALKLKVPVIKLVDGSSGGGSVTTIKMQGYAYLPHLNVLKIVVQQLNAGIPNLGAVVGPAIGLGAARVVSTHFSVMAADIGSMFNAGPKVVEGATFEEGLSFKDLGGPAVHCTNGTIDNLARDEEDCFQQIKTVLGYLPDCGQLQAPPVVEMKGDDVEREDVALRSIIPRRKGRMYNPWKIIESVVDRGSWFEIGKLWGRTGITGLARLGGRPVGILSLNCEVNGGALDAGGSQKLIKMIKLCDVMNLPIVQFLDIPGYAIGTVAERTATMKWGVELAKAYYVTTTPIFSVITRQCYGVAGGVMLDSREPVMRVAWPSANWGSLPLAGGLEVGHSHELKQIAQKEGEEGFKRRYKELEDMYLRMMNPVRSANAFNIEEIVDPKDTRKIVCRWTKEMYGIPMQERLIDRASGKIHPVFT